MKDEKIIKQIKKQQILTYIVMAISLVACILSLVSACSGNKKQSDFSEFKKVGITDVLAMFNDERSHVLYIGRDNCEACQEFLPDIKTAQSDLNFITNYLDITKINRESDAWQDLVEKLDIKETANINDESITDTYGNILDEKGVTPTIIIIDNNKQKAGILGVKSLGEYKDWLIENGI